MDAGSTGSARRTMDHWDATGWRKSPNSPGLHVPAASSAVCRRGCAVETSLASGVKRKKQANACPVARRPASTMRREFVTQTWSAFAHRASCFPRKTRKSVRRREYGAGRIGDLHQADKTSPHGEGQLARTNVVQKQPQTSIRRPTPKNSTNKQRASWLSSTLAVTRRRPRTVDSRTRPIRRL
jgi:hypothetical protein